MNMPVRLLRDWTDSESVNSLSANAEILFIRLIMKADDFGRFHGNVKLLRSLLFPLRDGIRDADMSRWMAECQKAGLIRVYQVADKPFVEIVKFQQRTRAMQSKFPSPDSMDDTQMSDTCPSDDRQTTDSRAAYSETETETETDSIDTSVSHPLAGDSVFDSLKSRISKLYKRKEKTDWSEKEVKKLKEVAGRQEALREFDEIEALYESGYQYFRRDIITLLNNWAGEVDRARLNGFGRKEDFDGGQIK